MGILSGHVFDQVDMFNFLLPRFVIGVLLLSLIVSQLTRRPW